MCYVEISTRIVPATKELLMKFPKAELDDKLAAAGEMLTIATDTHGNPYLIDPADGEHVYLEPEDYEAIG